MPQQKKKRQTRGHNDAYIDHNDPIIRIFLSDIARYPVLDETKLASLISPAQKGITTARQEIMLGNLKLIVRIAREFVSDECTLLDLVQEGCIGLNMAIDKYEISKNVKFCNYAGWWIRYRIIYSIWQDKIVFYPSSIRMKYNKILHAAEDFFTRNMRDPNCNELCEMTGLKTKELKNLPYYSTITKHKTNIDPDTLFDESIDIE